MTTPRERLSGFLVHLDSVFGVEPSFHPLDSTVESLPQVVCMVYRGIPEPGSITGVTYGLSESQHEEWIHGRPELIISVDSDDIAWPMALAEIANQLRGRCPFCYGDVINFGQPISNASTMSAFLVFVPAILDKKTFLGIDVGADLPVNLHGVFPIYEEERQVIAEIGLERFWHSENFDMYDVNRQKVVSQNG